MNKDFDVIEIGIFGSYVRGEAKQSSDLDILISLKPEHHVGLIKFNSLKEFLSNLLNIKVDLVLKTGIKPALKKYILNEVIYL
ncbi:MAG: nucleotidyltransferase family protein [Candidatus Gastranaerophilales bacterium]|nr:nucleotidyltransferase family protein [Candidatus Gastranaerophilales bacterium]